MLEIDLNPWPEAKQNKPILGCRSSKFIFSAFYMITFSFKLFFTERITILQTSETIILNISWSASILCFSFVEEDTSTQNGGTESFRYWPQQRKLGFHPWPEANQIYTYPWPKAKQSYIHCGWLMISFLQVGVLKFHLRITRLQFCLVYWLIIRGLKPPRHPGFILQFKKHVNVWTYGKYVKFFEKFHSRVI